MIRKFAALLSLALLGTVASAQTPQIAGRWSFVTLNDTTTQLENMGGPTEFDTVLNQSSKNITNPTGIQAGTDTSLCDNSASSGAGNIAVSGTANSGTNGIVLTFNVNKNASDAVPFKYIFTGTYSTSYKRTSTSGQSTTLTAISGTYTSSGCSSAEVSGTFVATYFPAINGLYTGFLDGPDEGPALDGPSPATVFLDAADGGASVTGWYAANANGTGAPSLRTTGGVACFVGPVTFNSSLSYVGGLAYSVFGQDAAGTKLWFNMYNSNPADNGTTSFSQAAVGIDTPSSTGNTGIANDGTNNQITVYYGISGGPCDGAGGGDAPFTKVAPKHEHKEKPVDPRHKHDGDRR